MPDVTQIDCGERAINSDALHVEVQRAFGAGASVSTARGRVLVNLPLPEADVTEAMRAEAKAVVDAHDETALTPGQAARREQQRRKDEARARLAGIGSGQMTPEQMRAAIADLIALLDA